MYYCTLAVFLGVYITLYWPLMTALENGMLLLIMLPLHWAFYKVRWER
jgi:hypothetical protein